MIIFKQNEMHKSAILVEETVKWKLENGEEEAHKVVITTEAIEVFSNLSDLEVVDKLIEIMHLPKHWDLGRANELALAKHVATLIEKASKPSDSRHSKKNSMSAAIR